MRQVSPQKPHRSSVTSPSQTRTSLSSWSQGGEPPESDSGRSYPPTALALMLVVGIVIGLLFAALISAFLGGGSPPRDRPKGSAPSSAGSSASADQQSDLQTTERSDQIRANKAPESRDARVFACGVDSSGYASARVLVTNGGADSATYRVRVIFASGADGGIISDDVASVRDLAPGTSAPVQSVNAVDKTSDGKVVCRLGGVSRY